MSVVVDNGVAYEIHWLVTEHYKNNAWVYTGGVPGPLVLIRFVQRFDPEFDRIPTAFISGPARFMNHGKLMYEELVGLAGM